MKANLLLAIAFSGISSAQTWTGATSGNWNDAGNWTGGLPASGPATALIFDNAIQPETQNNIPGGLTLNSLTFTENSGVRTTSGNALTFDGVNPSLRMLVSNTAGNSLLDNPLILNQTLTIEGGGNFESQFIIGSSATISGPGGIRCVGGITAFNSINTYSGETVVESGGLGVNRFDSFGNSPSITVQTGAWLQLIGPGNFTITKPLVIGGAGDPSFNNSYALAASGGGNKGWSGPIAITNDTTFTSFGAASLTVSGSSALNLDGRDLTIRNTSTSLTPITVSKVISGNGDLIFRPSATSAGALLTATNTFTGSISILSGKLAISSDENFGASPNPLTLDGGTLRATTGLTIPATRPISIGENGATFQGADGTQPNRAIVLNTPLSGPNPIKIIQRVTLDAANDFTGAVTVEPAATLKAATDASLGAVTSAIHLNGDATNPATIEIPPNFDPNREILVTGARGRIETTAPVTFAKAISGPGELALQTSSGAVTFTTANAHQGGTRLEGGIVKIHDDSALGPIDQPLTLAGQGTLAPSGNVTLSPTRPIRLLGGGFNTTGGEIHVPGNIESINNNSASISGTGIFRFDGTLNAGTYLERATLTGTGTLGGFVNVTQNATLAPGTATATGSLTVGDIRMDDGTLKIKIGSGASDRLIVTDGDLRLDCELAIVPIGPIAANQVFTIIEKNGTDYNLASLYSSDDEYLGNTAFTQGGIVWSINYSGGDGNDITLTALSGSSTPLAIPSISNFTVTPATSTDPGNLDSYPKISGTISGGIPNSSVFLESSTDLGNTQPWSTLETFTLDAAGTATFTDLTPFTLESIPRNFFRLRIP